MVGGQRWSENPSFHMSQDVHRIPVFCVKLQKVKAAAVAITTPLLSLDCNYPFFAKCCSHLVP